MSKLFEYIRSVSQNFPFVVGRALKKDIINYRNVYFQYRPDKYSENIDKYRAGTNFYSEEDLKGWNRGNYLNNAGDIVRFYFLNLCIDQLLDEGIKGGIAELGVYKGNSASLLARFARRINNTLYLFDTFEGFDQKDITGLDENVNTKSFTNTSLEYVRELVGDENVRYVKGYFPESLSQLGNSTETYSLVHIDCDLEKPFIAALDYFYPRMVKGGFLIMHDYSSLYWAGATKAVDEFFKDKPEFVMPVPDKSGTVVIRKV
jgi:hypothetical protein